MYGTLVARFTFTSTVDISLLALTRAERHSVEGGETSVDHHHRGRLTDSSGNLVPRRTTWLRTNFHDTWHWSKELQVTPLSKTVPMLHLLSALTQPSPRNDPAVGKLKELAVLQRGQRLLHPNLNPALGCKPHGQNWSEEHHDEENLRCSRVHMATLGPSAAQLITPSLSKNASAHVGGTFSEEHPLLLPSQAQIFPTQNRPHALNSSSSR